MAGGGLGAVVGVPGATVPPIQELHPQLPQVLPQPQLPQVLRQPQLPQVLRQPHVPHDPQLDPHEVQDDVPQVLQHDWQQHRRPHRPKKAEAGSGTANHSKASTANTVPKRRMTQSSCVKKGNTNHRT